MIKYRLAGMTLLTGGIALLTAGFALLAGPSASVLAGPAQQVEPFEDFACLDCHSDQDRLEELAVVEEEQGEALSSGPG